MSFQNYINEEKDIEELFGITDGKQFYDVSGHKYKLDIFKIKDILFNDKKSAELAIKDLTEDEGYPKLKIVKVELKVDITEV